MRRMRKALQRIETLRGGIYYRCASKGRGQTCRGGLISGRFLESEVVQRVLEKRSRAIGPTLADLDNLTGDAWHDAPLARRRALLAEFIQQVWVSSADVPVDRRVHIVWTGEESPTPRNRVRTESAG
jgi:hypothetical protein